jgi:hypothetical protein
MALTPALVCRSLLALQGLSLDEYAPESNDEIGYYLQTNAFVHKGLAGGYFTLAEKPAPAGFSHFGVHGPLFPVLYGVVGKALGWHLYSGPLFNCGFLTLSIAIFCLVLRPSAAQALFGALFLASYWPLYLSLISNLQDAIHYTFAVLFAAAFAALLAPRPCVRSPIFHLAFWLLLIYASLMRISWAMMVFPYLLLCRPVTSASDLCRRLALGIVIVLALLYTFRWLCAPYPGDAGAFLMNKIAAFEPASVAYFLRHAWHNVKCLITGTVTDQPCWPGMLVFYQALALGIIVAAWAVLRSSASRISPLERRRPAAGTEAFWHRLEPLPLREGLFQIYNIWALTVAMIFLYYVDRGGAWRMFSSHFLLATLLLLVSISRSFRRLVLLTTAVNLACALPCLESIEGFNLTRFGYVEDVRGFARAIEGLIVYEDGGDPWCNTILADRYPPCFAGLPPGIGVTVFLKTKDFPRWPKSKYLLMSAGLQKLVPGRPREVFLFPRGYFFPPGMERAVLMHNPVAHCPGKAASGPPAPTTDN